MIFLKSKRKSKGAGIICVITCHQEQTRFNKIRRVFNFFNLVPIYNAECLSFWVSSNLSYTVFVPTDVVLLYIDVCTMQSTTALKSFLETTKPGNHIHPIILCHNNKITFHNISLSTLYCRTFYLKCLKHNNYSWHQHDYTFFYLFKAVMKKTILHLTIRL